MKRRLISAFMVFALAFGSAQAVFADENETTLKQGEVKIEKQRLQRFDLERGYNIFDESEFKKIVETINNANGFYRARPKEIAGGYKRLYIVMKNGDVHTVSNQGNIYLEIDGDSYKAKSEYLLSFNEMLGEGNSAVPQLIPYIEW